MTSNLTCAKFLNRLFEGAVWHSSPASCRDELPERIEFITDHTELHSDVLYISTIESFAKWRVKNAPIQPGTIICLAEGRPSKPQIPSTCIGAIFPSSLSETYNRVSSILLSTLRESGESDFTGFFDWILSKKVVSFSEVEDRIHRFPHKITYYYRILIVSFDSSAGAENFPDVLKALSEFFPEGNIAKRKTHYVIVIPEASHDYQLSFDTTALNKVLARCGCRLGISNATRDLTSMRSLYMLTLNTISLAKRLDLTPGERIYFQEKYCVYNTLDFCTQTFMSLFGNDDVLLLAHPSIIGLTRYDRTHNNNLRDVLYNYLLYDRSVTTTAAKLYMHRNTVLNKLKKIKELTELNFDNENLRQRLIFSCQILRYYERVYKKHLRMFNIRDPMEVISSDDAVPVKKEILP